MLLFKLIYDKLFEVNKSFYRDERTCNLPLVGSPLPMVIILLAYLWAVLKVGPKMMETRKAIDVKLPMQIYNIMQVVLNLYIFCESFRLSFVKPLYNLTCQPYDPADLSATYMQLRYPAWAYYISKYLDLLDTVFFVMRKKSNQITFLHVYHHTAMVYGVWVYITLHFASHLTVIGVLNAFVHVCMYSYYLLTSMKLQLNVVWKKRLTQLQILQFLYLTIHFALPIVNKSCDIDLFWISIGFVQNLFMLILFSDFYIKAYMPKKRAKK